MALSAARLRAPLAPLAGIPELFRLLFRINILSLPPSSLISEIMKCAMMRRAERDDPLVTRLEPKGSRLSMPQMVCLARLAPADEARLFRHVAQMFLVPNATGCVELDAPFVSRLRPSLHRLVIAIGMALLCERLKAFHQQGSKNVDVVLAFLVCQLR